MKLLKVSTAVTVQIGPMIDDTDFKSYENGLSITDSQVFLSKNSGTYANRGTTTAPPATIGQGDYDLDLGTDDVGTLGRLRVSCKPTGALPIWEDFMVVPAVVYDALVLGTDNLDVSVVQWLGTTVATPTVAGVPEVDVTHVSGSLEDIATETLLSAIDAKIDIIDTNIDDIETDTSTTIPALIAALNDFDPTVTPVELLATGGTAGGKAADELIFDNWEEILTGGTHNTPNSSGRRLRQLGSFIFAEGTAQSGGNNNIRLAVGDVTNDGILDRAKVLLIGGLGAGQEAIITDSVASNDTLSVTPAWTVNPDVTTEYQVIPAQAHTTVRNGGYDGGFVFVNTIAGFTGTVKGVNGTSTNKSLDEADAYAIAVVENLFKFSIDPKSAIILPSNSSAFEFHGSNYTVALNNQNIADAEFNGASSITGIATASGGVNPPSFFLSGIGSVTLPPCNGFQCGFFGTFTIGTEGSFTFGSCASVFGLNPIIDFGIAKNASGFFLPDWTGGTVTIKNYGVGTGTYEFEISGNGDLIIDSSCTGGTIIVRGNINIIDNSGGAVTVTDSANISTLATAVNLAIVDGNVDDIETLLNAVDAKIDIIGINIDEIEADTSDMQPRVVAIEIDTDITIPALITALNDLSAAQVKTEMDTALLDIHLDHLFATTYDATSKPGVADALLNELMEDDVGVTRYTANALEQAPGGGGGDATQAKQDEILTDLEDIKGTGFVKDTHSLFDIETELAVVDGNVDDIETLLNIVDAKIDIIDINIDSIEQDTADMQPRVVAIEVDTGTTLPAQITGLNDPTVTEITADIDANSSQLIAIKLTTDSLPSAIKKNVGVPGFSFVMVDSNNNPLPGLGTTVFANRLIDGGVFGSCTNNVIELTNGAYKIDISNSDFNGGTILLRFNAVGAKDKFFTIVTNS